MAAKIPDRVGDILPRTSGNDCRMLLEKLTTLLGTVLLMKACASRFPPKRFYGSKQSSISAAVVQGAMELMVELFNPQRVVFRKELIVEPLSLPQEGRREQRGRLLQGSDLQDSPKFGKFGCLAFRKDRHGKASVRASHDQAAPKQPVQGLPDGLAADAETLGNQFLLEDGARRQLARLDFILQLAKNRLWIHGSKVICSLEVGQVSTVDILLRLRLFSPFRLGWINAIIQARALSAAFTATII